jgi:hypothetical protein
MYSKYFQLAGYATMIGGILLVAYWYLFAILMPYGQLSTTLSLLVLNKNWTFVNILGIFGASISLFGLSGIFLSLGEEASKLALIGFVFAFFGTLLNLATMFWETVIWPIIARHDPTLLDFQGPVYTSKIYIPYFIVAGIIFSLGFLLLGIAISNSDLYPSMAGILIAVGGPLFGLGPMFGSLQVYPRTVGITLFFIGLLWIGNILRLRI